MNHKTTVAAMLAWALYSPPGAQAAAPPLGLATDAVVVNVVDGDTLDLEVRYRVRVRLIDTWAPESDEPGGELATTDLRRHVLGKPVVLHVPAESARSVADLFTFGRVLGHVWLGDESVGRWQVARGNASTTKGGQLGK